MKNLYSHIQKKSKTINEDFGFASNMKNLFTDNFQGIRNIPELPIEANVSEWEEVSDFSKTKILIFLALASIELSINSAKAAAQFLYPESLKLFIAVFAGIIGVSVII